MLTQAEPFDQAGGYDVLPVREVIAIVKEWVELEAQHRPNFAGAYLWAGITALPADASFRLYRDVDVIVVVTEGAQDDNEEVAYRGLLLEVITKNLAEHQDVAAALSDPSAGPNLATTQILADPTGLLAPFQKACATGYRRRQYVQARCEAEKAATEAALAAMRGAAAPADRLDAVRDFLAGLSGLLAVAQLKRPTTRRTLTLLGDLLQEQGRPDLQDMAFAVMGSAHMSREQVEAMLEHFGAAFERAVQVYRTPVPYGFTLRPYVRPYMVDGARELIVEGSHREAVYWITCMDTAYLALANDAPEAEKPLFAAELHAIYAGLGLTSSGAWAERVATAERLAREIYPITDTLTSGTLTSGTLTSGTLTSGTLASGTLAAHHPAERYDE